MNLWISPIDLTFSNMLQISLRNSLNVFNFFDEALAHSTDELVLLFKALVENIFLFLRLRLSYKRFDVTSFLLRGHFVNPAKHSLRHLYFFLRA